MAGLTSARTAYNTTCCSSLTHLSGFHLITFFQRLEGTYRLLSPEQALCDSKYSI